MSLADDPNSAGSSTVSTQILERRSTSSTRFDDMAFHTRNGQRAGWVRATNERMLSETEFRIDVLDTTVTQLFVVTGADHSLVFRHGIYDAFGIHGSDLNF